MHDRADSIEAFPRTFCFAIPDPPVQSLDLRDDDILRQYSLRLVGRQRCGDLLKMFQPHSNVEPIENGRFGDASSGENSSKSRTSIGEGCQYGAFRSADGVEAPADQYLDVRIGLRDGAKNLSTTGLRFDIAKPHL
jgi:hypothetical protein